MRRWPCHVFFLFLIILPEILCIQDNFIHIILILDKSAIFYCLVNVFSIIYSTSNSNKLFFHFLIFDSESKHYLDEYFDNCHANIHYEIVNWASVTIQQQMLSSTGFDSWTIYSRIYLPMIFPVDKYIYLDNDIVINGDIAELFAQKLEPKSFRDLLPKSKQTAEPYRSKNSPVVGFVFETNQMYRGYIHSHFNVSHPLVRKVLQHNHPEIFFNAGVALVNADQWRKEGLTKKAETLLFENTLHHGLLFDSKAVGDQGLFYLLLDGRMTYLPHKFNMRRLPNKTVRFLDQNELGSLI